ncbi:hypothetical protein D3C87_1502650 [compost metagenome]
MGVVFHADLGAKEIEIAEEVLKIERRVGIGPVDPDENIFDRRSIPGLPHIRRTGQKHHGAVRLDHQRLEEAVAEGVIAGKPVHAFLGEKQNGVQLLFRHLRNQPFASGIEFRELEVQGHLVLQNCDCGNLPPVVGLGTVGRAAVGIEAFFIRIGA